MRMRYGLALVIAAAVAVLVAVLVRAMPARVPDVVVDVNVKRPARLRPDYADTVFPPNIAAPSVLVLEEGQAYMLVVRGERGGEVRAYARDPGLALPLDGWRKLLEANRGSELEFQVYVQSPDGAWQAFEPFRSAVAREKIDPYIVYRQIAVLYNFYTRMQIRERCLENYTDSVVLDNSAFDGGCMNCHSFRRGDTSRMLLQMRSGRTDHGGGMLLFIDGKMRMINTKTKFNQGLAGFPAWHPSGDVVAFSINKVRQFFHTTRTEVREGIDLNSDMAIYLVKSNKVTSTAAIARPDRLETWPEWSADGRYLYFCSSPLPWDTKDQVPPPNHTKAIYDLMRIPYDVENDKWGEVETVLRAEDVGLSINQPRTSPDGRFIVLVMSAYSGFPTLQPDADLYMLDLTTGKCERLAWNSDQAESWASWSRDGRWLIFSSKAGDGLFIRPWFSYVEKDGTVRKPFVLPQKDPYFYESNLRLYQMPVLTDGPVPIRGEQIAGPLRSGKWSSVAEMPLTGATPAATPSARSGAWQPAR